MSKCSICGAPAMDNSDVCWNCENDDMEHKNPLDTTFVPKIVAIDFDGTLCVDRFPDIGEPNPVMLELVRHLNEEGHKVILWTCRVNDRLREAVEWCIQHGVILDAVNDNILTNVEQYGTNPRKVYADLYIDDKSINHVDNLMDIHRIKNKLRRMK